MSTVTNWRVLLVLGAIAAVVTMPASLKAVLLLLVVSVLQRLGG